MKEIVYRLTGGRVFFTGPGPPIPWEDVYLRSSSSLTPTRSQRVHEGSRYGTRSLQEERLGGTWVTTDHRLMGGPNNNPSVCCTHSVDREPPVSPSLPGTGNRRQRTVLRTTYRDRSHCFDDNEVGGLRTRSVSTKSRLSTE